MNIKSLFQIASITALLGVAGIALLLIPQRVWSSTSIGALALFCSSIGFGLYSPYMLPDGQKGGDAATTASIGTMGLIVPSLIGWTALTFLLSLAGLQGIVWAMMVITVAGFVTSFALIHAAAKITDEAASANAGFSERSVWRSQILALMASVKDTDTRKALERLAEKIQFGSSAIASMNAPTDLQLDDAIKRLIKVVGSDSDDIQTTIVEISCLLDRREQEYKLMRSKV